ncbi:hypothetical protein HZA38_00475 [Candidatus Peregrinibacteria bacterium]|nr:hypothetical protein [Candidatus Peregrinibacteria bacterium]
MGIYLFPKVETRIEIWRAERDLQEYSERIAAIKNVASPYRESPEIAQSFEKISLSENFSEKISHLEEKDIPKEKILTVPFICQNPFRDEAHWKFHEESCEEAALLQTYLFMTNSSASPEKAHEIILDMIEWEKRPENFGRHKDLLGEEMKQFIVGYYHLPEESVFHVKNLNKILIQKIITLGYPLIVPIQGDLLRNPFYPYPGYHMLTVIGFTEDRVITNDVGTKRGEKYSYEWERFLSANLPVGNDAFVILSTARKKE